MGWGVHFSAEDCLMLLQDLQAHVHVLQSRQAQLQGVMPSDPVAGPR